MLERDPVEKFHGDKCFAVLFTDIVDGADIGVVQSGCGLTFTLKTSEGLGIARNYFRQKFEGDETMKAGILGLINNAHPAAAESFKHGVMRDGLTDRWVFIHQRQGSLLQLYYDEQREAKR
jgi:hypothetical protein